MLIEIFFSNSIFVPILLQGLRLDTALLSFFISKDIKSYLEVAKRGKRSIDGGFVINVFYVL